MSLILGRCNTKKFIFEQHWFRALKALRQFQRCRELHLIFDIALHSTSNFLNFDWCNRRKCYLSRKFMISQELFHQTCFLKMMLLVSWIFTKTLIAVNLFQLVFKNKLHEFMTISVTVFSQHMARYLKFSIQTHFCIIDNSCSPDRAKTGQFCPLRTENNFQIIFVTKYNLAPASDIKSSGKLSNTLRWYMIKLAKFRC